MKRLLGLILTCLTMLTAVSCSGAGAPMNEDMGGMSGFSPVGGMEDSNQFADIAENPFVDVSENPISTFSADVDTGAYPMLRKLVGMGYSLQEVRSAFGSAVRTEELLNYFSYHGKQPEKGELFGVSAMMAACPWNAENLLLMLTLSTEKAVEQSANNLVFLIDVSGSMAASDKLDLIKKAFSHLVQNLNADDTVSIVTYSGEEKVVLDGCSGSKKDRILRAVNHLEASGSTNGESGIRRAYAIAEKHFCKDGNNRIILASDGDLNVGISSPEELRELVEEKRKTGIYLSTLGFGYGNYHDTNMETLADCGNGVYAYIDGEKEAEKVFGRDLLSTLYTVAEDVKLQVTFSADAVAKYRLIGYENRLLDAEDFADDTKDAGEVGAGHSVTVCYELALTEQAMQTDEWMELAVRYKDPGAYQSKENRYVVGADDVRIYGTGETPDADFELCAGITVLSMVLRESSYLPQGWTLQNAMELLSAAADGSEERAELISLVESLYTNLD